MIKSKSELKDAWLFYREVKIKDPDYLKRYEERLKQQPAIFKCYALLPNLLSAFCDYHSIETSSIVGIRHGIEANERKKKFVAAMVVSYHPNMITGHDEKVKERLCEEVAFVLNLHREQISKYASESISALNPDIKFSTAYRVFKEEIYEIVEYLKDNFEPAKEHFETQLFALHG